VVSFASNLTEMGWRREVSLLRNCTKSAVCYDRWYVIPNFSKSESIVMRYAHKAHVTSTETTPRRERTSAERTTAVLALFKPRSLPGWSFTTTIVVQSCRRSTEVLEQHVTYQVRHHLQHLLSAPLLTHPQLLPLRCIL
jgi:hypothetical protein